MQNRILDTQDPSIYTLFSCQEELARKGSQLTAKEKEFIDKMRKIERMEAGGCEKFQLYFHISEAHWLLSSIKYEESCALYNSIHKAYMQMLRKSLDSMTGETPAALSRSALQRIPL